MEEVINCVTNQSSPQELAIQFLLRYAGCRNALMSSGNEGVQKTWVTPAPALGSTSADPSGELSLLGSVEPSFVPARARVSEESYATRFSRAYAAARHMTPSGHAVWEAPRKCA